VHAGETFNTFWAVNCTKQCVWRPGPAGGGAIALPRLPSRYKGKGGNGQERERKKGKKGRDVNGLRVMGRGKAD